MRAIAGRSIARRSARRTRIYKEGQTFESAQLPGLTVRLEDIFTR